MALRLPTPLTFDPSAHSAALPQRAPAVSVLQLQLQLQHLAMSTGLLVWSFAAIYIAASSSSSQRSFRRRPSDHHGTAATHFSILPHLSTFLPFSTLENRGVPESLRLFGVSGATRAAPLSPRCRRTFSSPTTDASAPSRARAYLCPASFVLAFTVRLLFARSAVHTIMGRVCHYISRCPDSRLARFFLAVSQVLSGALCEWSGAFP
ncbi:hypothetical protein C8J57DRAFT_433281 [Mycena rebaudengoi]|nr:hypothetical protein C8J57DRAFT_433281 [Mycena rebaudengoi]